MEHLSAPLPDTLGAPDPAHRSDAAHRADPAAPEKAADVADAARVEAVIKYGPAIRPVAVSPAHPSVGLSAGPSERMPAHPAAASAGTSTDAPVRHLRLVRSEVSDEDGSLVTEYGLLAVVAATIAGVVITWASNGALTTLFNALLRQARSLVGA